MNAYPKNGLLTATEARYIFRYNKRTGVLSRRANGKIIGSRSRGVGYLHVYAAGNIYGAHRLIYLMVTGRWPPCDLDHKNGQKRDNRWRNLRLAPGSINQQNLRKPRKDALAGMLGVKAEVGGFFGARIQINGKRTYLGFFRTAQAAQAAYLKAKHELHPGFIGLARG